MYLAYRTYYQKRAYSLKESIYSKESNTYISKTLFDLGTTPQSHINEEEPGYFTFSDSLVEAVQPHAKKNYHILLEELLFDFFSPETKKFLLKYPSRKKITISPLSQEEKVKIQNEIDLFDLRRLYFLRYGAIDQRHLHKLHKKCCRPLLSKSRDEKEYYFTKEEAVLQPLEKKSYVYAIFNLQQHFSQSFAAFMPAGLPETELEDYFLLELCKLNQQPGFFNEDLLPNVLHHHLQRYVIMFFDSLFQTDSFASHFINRFIRDHRTFVWPETSPGIDDQTIFKLFGKNKSELQQLDKRELTSLYRKAAKKLHPDKGGDHELFIQLTEAYKQILENKR